jgi:hypothetical protein
MDPLLGNSFPCFVVSQPIKVIGGDSSFNTFFFVLGKIVMQHVPIELMSMFSQIVAFYSLGHSQSPNIFESEEKQSDAIARA